MTRRALLALLPLLPGLGRVRPTKAILKKYTITSAWPQGGLLRMGDVVTFSGGGQ